MLKEKRPVYNGYVENYKTGKEIRENFKDCYETYGKHHKKIKKQKIKIKNIIKNETIYRIFINKSFCKIMDNKTDDSILFFGYTRNI